ncbi:hypothetical protein [Flavobacterium sp. ASW18X]|uniref:hypothetical protein n=1 Tax=Flavobacterium sp. ASW18X TaxID=2572595 RepID=UPI0010AE9554|nr:hypothetical protein [Flavobacterium sp. ASW18X]TKD58987.1 hypothetical protein FBT53_14480 [Flavobacterium sp. ASW18X]
MVQNKKNSGKLGSIPNTSIEYKEPISLDDLMYVFSGKNTIEALYGKLRLVYDRSLHQKNDLSYTEWSKKVKLSTRLMPAMKKFGYCNEDSEWQLPNPPRKGDAIILQLAIRKSERLAKEKSKDK